MAAPQIRNARLVNDGMIECEIKHASLGWIPFGAIEGEDGLSGEVFAAAAPTATDARDPAAGLVEARAQMRMSRRQLLIGLADMGWITEAEAIAAAGTGAMPAAVETAISVLDPDSQVRARITWAAMSEARRLDPLVALLAAAQGVGNAAVDAFFTTYSSI